MNIEQAKKKLNSIKGFKNAPQIETIQEGLSGAHVFKVTSEVGQNCILKFSDVDKNNVRAQALASERSLAPKVFYSDAECVLMEEIQAEPFPQEGRVEVFSNFLRELNQVQGEGFNAPNPYQILEEACAKVATVPFFTDKDLENFKKVQEGAERWKNAAKTFTHNDLNPSNLIYQDGKLRAVDWASAGLNDPYFDLATISNWYFLGDELLKAYLERTPNEDELAHYHYMQALAKTLVGFGLLEHSIAMGLDFNALPQRGSLPSLSEFQSQLHKGDIQLNSGLAIYQFAILIIESIKI